MVGIRGDTDGGRAREAGELTLKNTLFMHINIQIRLCTNLFY